MEQARAWISSQTCISWVHLSIQNVQKECDDSYVFAQRSAAWACYCSIRRQNKRLLFHSPNAPNSANCDPTNATIAKKPPDRKCIFLVWHVSRTADSCSGIFTRAVFKVTVIASWEFDDSIFSIKTRIYRNSPLLFNYWLGLFWVFQVIGYNVAHPGAISVSFQVNEVIILLCLSNSDHPTFFFSMKTWVY